MEPTFNFLQSLNSLFPWHSGHNYPFIFTLLAGFLVLLSFRSRRRRLQLPPGPPGVPLLGNLPFLDPELHTYFTELARKYGPIVKLQLGSKIGIIINSPSVAREVLKDHDITFANHDVPRAARAATYGGYDIVWSPYGPEWRMLRKVCTMKMLSNASLDSVYELRRREVRNTVAHLYRRAGSAVNIGEQGFLTVFNIVTSMLWGGSVDGDERDGIAAEFRELISDITLLLGKPNVSDFFPSLARFDLQGIEKQMLNLAPKLDNIFEKMINQRLRMADADEKQNKNDFLQFLLQIKDEGDSKTPLTMVQIKGVLMMKTPLVAICTPRLSHPTLYQ
ncbi:Geraniol 8-hydroxylase, partial [Cucurbita argyrosperma subsp. sororia]